MHRLVRLVHVPKLNLMDTKNDPISQIRLQLWNCRPNVTVVPSSTAFKMKSKVFRGNSASLQMQEGYTI